MTDSSLISKELTGRIESVVKPLNNPVRLRMLILLHHTPLSYSDLLEELEIESGSFYWHLKKLKGLVQQHHDKKYSLSPLGEKAYQLLFDEKVESTVPQEEPYWYLPIKSVVSNLYNNLIFSLLLFALSFFILFVVEVRMVELGLTQIGVNTSGSTYPFSEYSVLLSFLLITSLYMVSVIYSKKFIGDGQRKTVVDWLKVLSLASTFVMLSLLSVTYIYLPHNIIGMLGDQRYVVIIFSSATLIASVLTLTSLGDVVFGFGFKNSLILVLILYYPVVIVSFVLS